MEKKIKEYLQENWFYNSKEVEKATKLAFDKFGYHNFEFKWSFSILPKTITANDFLEFINNINEKG
jgi:hypothetical protein